MRVKKLIQWVRALFSPGDAPGTIQAWDPVPFPEAPSNCPFCSGRLEREGEDWVCRGIESAEEARRVHSRPEGITELPPCGWRGRHDEFGVKWA